MKNYIKNNMESVKEYLNDLNTSDLVNTWNEFVREHRTDDEIFNNDEEFFNTYFNNRVMDAVRSIHFGDYRYQDEYIQFNGYGNLETTNDPEEWIDIDELAEAIIDNPGDFYDIELEEEDEEPENDDEIENKPV